MFKPESRLAGLQGLFPVGPHAWYQGRQPGHAARAVLASLEVDIGIGREIDQRALARGITLLQGYLEVIDSRPALAVLANEVRAFLRSPQADREQARALGARLIAALPPAAEADGTVRRLHQEAIDGEHRANAEYEEAYQRCLRPATKAPAAASAPVGGPSANEIEAAIRAQYPDEQSVSVASLQHLAGGYSKCTLLCDVTGAKALPARLVIRADVGIEYSGAPVPNEYATFVALHRAGVRVPRPILLNKPSDGSPAFMIVEWAPGNVSAFLPTFRSADLCRQLGGELAKFHSVPLEHLQHVRGANRSTSDVVLADVTAMEVGWRKSGCRDPIIEFGFHWLRDNVGLTEGRRCLQHGDYRLHNILCEGEVITAVLDWEHARVSNPADDLAYVRGAAEALGSWEEFLAAYVGAGGIAPDASALRYYDAYTAVFTSVIHGQMELLFNEQPTERPLASMGSALQYRPDAMARLYRTLSADLERP